MNPTQQKTRGSWEITRLRIFGYGFKWNIQIYGDKGKIDRVLACQTSDQGFGVWIGGVVVDMQTRWRGLGMSTAKALIHTLMADNPWWMRATDSRLQVGSRKEGKSG